MNDRRTDRTVTCLLQVNQGYWCQETYETASRDARRRARTLRLAGYQISVSAMGQQVTSAGLVNLTVVGITPGENVDTYHLPTDGWRLLENA